MTGHRDFIPEELSLLKALGYEVSDKYQYLSPYHHMRDCAAHVVLNRIENEYVDVLRFCLAYMAENPRDDGYYEGFRALWEVVKQEETVPKSINLGLDKLATEPEKSDGETVTEVPAESVQHYTDTVDYVAMYKNATKIDATSPTMFGVLYGVGSKVVETIEPRELSTITSAEWSDLSRKPNHKLVPIKGQPYTGFSLVSDGVLVAEMRAIRGKGKEYLKVVAK